MGKSETADFGRRLRELRKARGLSQEELADRAGLHPKFIGEVERGASDLKLRSIIKIASGLGLSPADFFSLCFSRENLSPEGREVLDLVISTIKRKDRKRLQKLKTFIKDIL